MNGLEFLKKEKGIKNKIPKKLISV